MTLFCRAILLLVLSCILVACDNRFNRVDSTNLPAFVTQKGNVYTITQGQTRLEISANIAGRISSLKIDWIEWLKKRIIRLYPNYWLAIILSIILLAVFSRINIKSFPDLIFMGIGVPGYQRFKTLNPGFWFFSVILQAYLITPIIFSICKGKAKNILVLGIVIGTIWKIVCLANSAEPYFFIFLLQSNLITSYIFPLCLGIYWGFIYCD